MTKNIIQQRPMTHLQKIAQCTTQAGAQEIQVPESWPRAPNAAFIIGTFSTCALEALNASIGFCNILTATSCTKAPSCSSPVCSQMQVEGQAGQCESRSVLLSCNQMKQDRKQSKTECTVSACGALRMRLIMRLQEARTDVCVLPHHATRVSGAKRLGSASTPLLQHCQASNTIHCV